MTTIATTLGDALTGPWAGIAGLILGFIIGARYTIQRRDPSPPTRQQEPR